jgi:hypothetical protein
MPYPRDKPHARIYRNFMDLPAWTTLNSHATRLLIELLGRYRPQEPNQFEISDRTASKLIGCARNTARKALEQLEDRGWIKVISIGKIKGPRAARASVYALTHYPLSVCEPALKSYLKWKPEPIQRLKTKPSTDHFRAFNGSLQRLETPLFGSITGEVKH